MREYVLATLCAAVLVFVAFFGAYSGGAVREPLSAAQQQHDKARYGGQQNPEGKTPKIENSDSFWDKTKGDPVAYFTYVLSMFTGVLGTVSIFQLWFLNKSDKTARIAAEAANLSADALRRTERGILIEYVQLTHIPGIRAFTDTLYTTAVRADDHTMDIDVEVYIQFSLKNYGKTPVTIIDVCAYCTITNTPWATGGLETIDLVLTEYTISPQDSSGTMRFRKTLVVSQSERAALKSGALHIFFIGLFTYNDVFGVLNSRQFAWIYDPRTRRLRPHESREHSHPKAASDCADHAPKG